MTRKSRIKQHRKVLLDNYKLRALLSLKPVDGQKDKVRIWSR